MSSNPPDSLLPPDVPEPPKLLRHASCISIALIIIAAIAVVATLYAGRTFFIPLLIGIFISYALRPMVNGLQKWRIPRPVAAALVLSILVGGTSWITYSLSDEATAMLEKLPDAARKLRRSISAERSAMPTAIQSVQEAANELQAVAADVARKPGTRPTRLPAADPASWARDYAFTQWALMISVIAQAPIVLLLAYFLLASGNHFRKKLVQLVGPALSQKKDVLRMLEEIDVQVQRYLFVTLASNVLIAVSTWLAFEAMGVEQAGIWGVAAGILHFIPFLGTVLVAAAAGIAGFLQFGTLLQALGVAMVAMLLSGLIGLLFATWLQSRLARVHSAVLFLALLFFGCLWGIAGLLLGALLIVIIKVICDHVDSLKPFGELLGK